MPELVSRTARIRRGWLDRLINERLYETKVTDGYHEATGRGATSHASEQAARRTWETKFGQATEYDPPSPAQSITLNAGDSTSLGKLREVIGALRADNGRLLRWLIHRLANDGRQEHKKLAEILIHHPKLRYFVGQ
jgi:hypothetical protein